MENHVMIMKFSFAVQVTDSHYCIDSVTDHHNFLYFIFILAAPMIETTVHMQCLNQTYFDLIDQPNKKSVNIKCNANR